MGPLITHHVLYNSLLILHYLIRWLGQSQLLFGNMNARSSPIKIILIYSNLILMYTAGHREASEVLIYAGADATASMNGITPLQLARDMGHEDIYRMLRGKVGHADYSEDAMDVSEHV